MCASRKTSQQQCKWQSTLLRNQKSEWDWIRTLHSVYTWNWILELLCSSTANQPVMRAMQVKIAKPSLQGKPHHPGVTIVDLFAQSVIWAQVIPQPDCLESWTTANEGCKNQSNRSIAAWMRPWSLCKWSECRIHSQNRLRANDNDSGSNKQIKGWGKTSLTDSTCGSRFTAAVDTN